jgi:N-methylhydantoinase B
MTNTRNTPIEELEHRYPVRVERLTVRRGSGGRGRRRGGDGIEKVVVAQRALTATFLGERHLDGPPGAAGGGAGAPGELWRRSGRTSKRLPSKCAIALSRGDRLDVRTPGGGGHGRS